MTLTSDHFLKSHHCAITMAAHGKCLVSPLLRQAWLKAGEREALEAKRAGLPARLHFIPEVWAQTHRWTSGSSVSAAVNADGKGPRGSCWGQGAGMLGAGPGRAGSCAGWCVVLTIKSHAALFLPSPFHHHQYYSREKETEEVKMFANLFLANVKHTLCPGQKRLGWPLLDWPPSISTASLLWQMTT